MDAETKIRKARVELQGRNPFFSYLTMHMNLVKVDSEKAKSLPGWCNSMGVDKHGNLYYDEKFVETLSQEVLVGVLCHEVLHVVFEHTTRKGDRDMMIFNVATDIVVNDILNENSFQLPEGGVLPENHEVNIGNIKIVDTDKKTAEEVYNEIYKKAKKTKGNCVCGKCPASSKGKSNGTCGGFDSNIYSAKDEKGKGKGKERDWKKVLSEAAAYAKQKGNIPLGMERLIDEVLYPKMPWREILYKYITREIPYDYTYGYPSKKSVATGIYMPSVKREQVEVVVSLDTSGSIGQEELTDFVSEMIGIAKSFQSVKMTVIVADCEVQDVLEVKNGNINTLMELKPKGGGGTAHEPVFDYIKENMPSAKILVALTDGYTSFPNEESVKTIWVLSKNHAEKSAIPFGDIVEII